MLKVLLYLQLINQLSVCLYEHLHLIRQLMYTETINFASIYLLYLNAINTNEPTHEVLVLLALAISQDSYKLMHQPSLARALNACTHGRRQRFGQKTICLLFVCFDSLRPSQQFFNYIGTGLNQY